MRRPTDKNLSQLGDAFRKKINWIAMSDYNRPTARIYRKQTNWRRLEIGRCCKSRDLIKLLQSGRLAA